MMELQNDRIVVSKLEKKVYMVESSNLCLIAPLEFRSNIIWERILPMQFVDAIKN